MSATMTRRLNQITLRMSDELSDECPMSEILSDERFRLGAINALFRKLSFHFVAISKNYCFTSCENIAIMLDKTSCCVV